MLRNALGVPFVYSVESLEDHRSHSANAPFNMAIKSIEWLGFYEAGKVSVKSEWMRDEIVRIYKVPPEKIQVVLPGTGSWVSGILEMYKAVGGGARKS
jgi:hypothetical protein